MIAPTAAAMGVYDGTLRIGEIDDRGKKNVVGRVQTASGGLRPIGIFDDRKAAMQAVSEAYARSRPAAGAPEGPEAA